MYTMYFVVHTLPTERAVNTSLAASYIFDRIFHAQCEKFTDNVFVNTRILTKWTYLDAHFIAYANKNCVKYKRSLNIADLRFHGSSHRRWRLPVITNSPPIVKYVGVIMIVGTCPWPSLCRTTSAQQRVVVTYKYTSHTFGVMVRYYHPKTRIKIIICVAAHSYVFAWRSYYDCVPPISFLTWQRNHNRNWVETWDREISNLLEIILHFDFSRTRWYNRCHKS